MRYAAIKRDFYTADLNDVEYDTAGVPVSQTFRESRALNIDIGDGSGLLIYSEEPLFVGTVITNIKDRAGQMLYPTPDGTTGFVYRIFNEEPTMSVFGIREGFRARADRVGV